MPKKNATQCFPWSADTQYLWQWQKNNSFFVFERLKVPQRGSLVRSYVAPGQCAPSRPCWSGTSGKTWRKRQMKWKMSDGKDVLLPERLLTAQFIPTTLCYREMSHFVLPGHNFWHRCQTAYRRHVSITESPVVSQIECKWHQAAASLWASRVATSRWLLRGHVITNLFSNKVHGMKK